MAGPDSPPLVESAAQTKALTKEGIFGTWIISNSEEGKEEPETIIRQQRGFKGLK